MFKLAWYAVKEMSKMTAILMAILLGLCWLFGGWFIGPWLSMMVVDFTHLWVGYGLSALSIVLYFATWGALLKGENNV